MLADGCEAYVRSQNPETDDELRSLIKDMVDRRVDLGQLDNTGLTLRDLKVIIDSFTTTLKGTYHARVDYPEESEVREVRLVCIDNGISPISSRNRVPLSASSNFPIFRPTAPVKAPFS